MKKSALGLAAVMTASLVALPLAACGSGNSLGLDIDIDLADYAVTLDDWLEENGTTVDAFSTADTYTGTVSTLFSSSRNSTLITVTNYDETSDNKTTVYNAATNTKIGDSYSSVSTNYTHYAIGTKTATDTNTYDVIADNGQVLVSNAASNPSINTYVTKYVGDPAVRKYFTSISYTAADDTNTVIYIAEENGEYTKYTKDQVKDSAFDTTVGTTLDAIGADIAAAHDLYGDDDAEKKTELDAYTYSAQDTIADKTNYVFYKDGKQCGTLSLEANETYLATIGTSMFYQKRTVVDSYATEGFNAVYTYTSGSGAGSGSTKALIEYYRYDIAKNSVSSVNSDYIFTYDVDLLYNNKEESYDLATAEAVKKQDGIAYIEIGNSGIEADSKVVIHANGSMEDASNALFNFDTVVELKEDRYYVKNTNTAFIIDGDMELVASIPSARLTKQGLVFSSNSRYGLADFDGKVVMTNQYASLNFYGDKALTTVYTNDKPSEKPYVVSASDPNGKIVTSVVSCDETAGESLLTTYGGLIVKSASDGYTVYNYDGTKLGETISTSSYPQQVCNRYWAVYANGTTYLYR